VEKRYVPLVFLGTSFLYLWGLFRHLGTELAVDAGDPTLNAAVLWWNATTVPFTSQWWNQPWFHAATGVTAFTENLMGLWPIASPIYWLTRNPVTTYNLTFFLSWPLCAIAAYWLVRRLTPRTDAAIVAGFAFGFAPYRASAEMGHLQSLSVFWLPVVLGAMHAYTDERRRRWLVVFGGAWVLQSLANGYYMMFGAVLIALWLAWFGSTARNRRAALHLGVAWVVASLVLLPILLGYQRIHDHYGLSRTFLEARAFGAHAESWFQVSPLLRFWRGVLPAGKDTFFPGLTVVLLIVAAIVTGLSRSRADKHSARRLAGQAALAIGMLVGLAATIAFVIHGPISIRSGGSVVFKMSDPYRALALLAACAAPLLWLSRIRDAIASRQPFVFYLFAALVMALLACGPALSAYDRVLLEPAPYRWLMALPGFDQLRVPSRFWMIGTLCLAVAAGLGFQAIVRAKKAVTYGACAIVSAGILADGWLTKLPSLEAPHLWTSIAGADARLPLLELPLGPDFDNAATFRTIGHHRAVMNGVSGFDPPHYGALHVGLRSRDPEMLPAIASLGAYEISIEHANDRRGEWQQFVEAVPGASIVGEDSARRVFRIPALPRDPPVVGAALPIAGISSSRGDPSRAIDHRLDTDWLDFPQEGTQWLLVDLGRVEKIGGVSLAIGEHSADFPRGLAIDISTDGHQFAEIWRGSGAAAAFLALLQAPRTAWLRLPLPHHDARFVRIGQTAWERAGWRVPELEINAIGPPS